MSKRAAPSDPSGSSKSIAPAKQHSPAAAAAAGIPPAHRDAAHTAQVHPLAMSAPASLRSPATRPPAAAAAAASSSSSLSASPAASLFLSASVSPSRLHLNSVSSTGPSRLPSYGHMTKAQLLSDCKSLGIRGVSALKKADLIKRLQTPAVQANLADRQTFTSTKHNTCTRICCRCAVLTRLTCLILRLFRMDEHH